MYIFSFCCRIKSHQYMQLHQWKMVGRWLHNKPKLPKTLPNRYQLQVCNDDWLQLQDPNNTLWATTRNTQQQLQSWLANGSARWTETQTLWSSLNIQEHHFRQKWACSTVSFRQQRHTGPKLQWLWQNLERILLVFQR